MEYPYLGKPRKNSIEDYPSFLERAEAGYGLNLEMNIKICEEDDIKNVWTWLNHFKTSGAQTEGILQIIDKNECLVKEEGLHKVYSSVERTKALAICNWDCLENSKALQDTCNNLESIGLKMKAVMFAIFAFNNNLALSFVKEGSLLTAILQNLQEKEANMLKFYKNLAKHEEDRYVKNILFFLSGVSYYSKILDSLSVVDSAAFALRFLNDFDLKAHLKSIIDKGFTQGLLQTLIISGFSPDSPGLLTKYFENTSDLQTVGILSIFAQQFLRSEVFDNFVFAYKTQLNRNDLFNAKCLFEIEETKLLNKKKEKCKGIKCYFCNNSIATSDILSNPAFKRRGDPQSVWQPFMNHCPSCSASLPRCCVCLKHLFSHNPYFINEKSKKTDFHVDLFIWCEKCHHGGHSSHLLDWFAESSECPVSNCGCACNSLDSTE